MDLAQKYSIIYEKKTGKRIYKDDYFSRDFVNYILGRFEEERDKKATEGQPTSRQIVDSELYKCMLKKQEEETVLMLDDIKKCFV